MDERTQRRLATLNAKGMDIATRLADLLAGKDVDLSDFSLYARQTAEEKKEARLRAFLDQINGARRRLRAGTAGRCLACGTAFSDVEMDEMPWLERCGDCVAADRPITAP